jgi:hypothetical protein
VNNYRNHWVSRAPPPSLISQPIAAELAKDAADIEQSSKGGSAGGKKASASGAAPTPSELIARKAHIFFSTCKKPERVQAAIAGIVTGFAGVLAVLQSNFARTVALGAALAADLEKRVCCFVASTFHASCRTGGILL